MTSPCFALATTEPIAAPALQSTFVVAARSCGIAATERLRRRPDAAIRICPYGLRFLCAPWRPKRRSVDQTGSGRRLNHRLRDEPVAEIVPNTQPHYDRQQQLLAASRNRGRSNWSWRHVIGLGIHSLKPAGHQRVAGRRQIAARSAGTRMRHLGGYGLISNRTSWKDATPRRLSRTATPNTRSPSP